MELIPTVEVAPARVWMLGGQRATMKLGLDGWWRQCHLLRWRGPGREQQGLVLDLHMYQGRAWSSGERAAWRHTFGCYQHVNGAQSQHVGENPRCSWKKGVLQGETWETSTFRDPRIWTSKGYEGVIARE